MDSEFIIVPSILALAFVIIVVTGMLCSKTWDKNLNERYKTCAEKCKDVRDCQDILRN